MLRRLSETFTATHLVAVFAIAVGAPSALYAVTYSNVAVTDATSGATAMVDGGHKLWTYDSIAGYLKNPLYAVNIVDSVSSGATSHAIYTVPAGKVLIVKSISWSYFANTEGTNNYVYLYDSGLNTLYNLEGTHVAESLSATLDPGLIVRAGTFSLLYFGASGSAARTYIQGYLIPAGAVPPAPSGAVAATAPIGRPQ